MLIINIILLLRISAGAYAYAQVKTNVKNAQPRSQDLSPSEAEEREPGNEAKECPAVSTGI